MTSTNNYNQLDEDDYYFGKYDEFESLLLRLEFTIFPKNEFVGISASLDQNIGK